MSRNTVREAVRVLGFTGLRHDLSGSWQSSAGWFITMGTLALLAGLPAARQGVVGVRADALVPESRYRAAGQQSTP